MSQNRFQAYQNGIFQLLDVISPYFILNMAWFVLSLPIVTLVPATGGLYYATYVLARDGDAGLADLWHGFRTHFWQSWWWFGLNMLAYGLLFVNFTFYGAFSGAWVIWVRATIIIVTLVWSGLQLYMFPFLMVQEDKRLMVALRNSYVALVFQPLQTFGFVILTLALVGLSTIFALPSWIIITASLCLTISNRAAIRALKSLHPELFM
ncbi:MAG: DUF624 domain-containing protein [Chloroflexota bacterium]